LVASSVTKEAMNLLARILLSAILAVAATAAMAQAVRVDHAEVELVAAADAVVPGRPLDVGLVIRHDPHWHTYWRVPGDSGLPTTIGWQLPAGFTAGPIEWPVPKRLPIGPLMNFGYEGELLLPVRIAVPADLSPGQTVRLKARADWLICKEVCIPGGADLQLTLPVRSEATPSGIAPLFGTTRAQVPQPVELAAASATIDGARVRLAFKPTAAVSQLEFFPLEEARIEPAAAQTLRTQADGASLYLAAVQPVAAGFTRLKGVLVANGGPAAAPQGGWAGEVDLPLVSGVVQPVSASAAPVAAGDGGTAVTLWVALAGAFIGGLILNLMPCVFPVLSLKLVGLMQHERADAEAGHPHASLRTHGIAFAAGVVLCFVLLAGLLLALRAAGAQLGWGFQLQTPWVIAALMLLFFLIGLNLIGTYEFAFGGALASSSAAQRLQGNQLGGSFATGLLAVVIAAPCTAPFMGAALGYAITQPAPIALAVFAMLGVGMATPYLALTWMPVLLARLPRPGVWMLRFKQVMAFPMFATCVWLVWVLAQQIGLDSLALVLIGLVLVAFAAWAYGLSQAGASVWRWVALAAAPLALFAVFAGPLAGQAPPRGELAADATAAGWRPWSRAAEDAALAAGKPLFIDFTAAWCVTCQANKRMVLNAGVVQAAFSQRGVVMLRADWTNRDDEITRELARFNRNGVPLYVLYGRSGKPQVLPEILTERIVLDALGRL